MKKPVKNFFAICFIVIPLLFEFYLLFSGIQAEIKNGYKNNGYMAFLLIIPSGSLILSSCAYFFVKLKHFPLLNMLFGLISLSIGEIVVWFRYQLSFMTLLIENVILMIVVISFWIFIKSLIFKKIYQWL